MTNPCEGCVWKVGADCRRYPPRSSQYFASSMTPGGQVTLDCTVTWAPALKRCGEYRQYTDVVPLAESQDSTEIRRTLMEE